MASTDRAHLDPTLANSQNLYANEGESIGYNTNALAAGQHVWPPVDSSLSYGNPYASSTYSQAWSQPVNRPSSTNPVAQYASQPQAYGHQYYGNSPNLYQPIQPNTAAYDGLPASTSLQAQQYQQQQQQQQQQQRAVAQHRQNPYQNPSPSSTISPAALQNPNVPVASPASHQPASQALPSHPIVSVAPQSQIYDSSDAPTSLTRLEPPPAIEEGNFSIIPYDELAAATQSRRLHKFVNISVVTQDLPLTKSTVPNYVPRKSYNELKQLAATNTQIALRLAKEKAPKVAKILVPRVQVNVKTSSLGASGKNVKGEADLVSLESSSEDESDYESSSDEEEAEVSPLPATRPQQPLEAARYDTIKAVWLPRNKYARPDQIRLALKDFWEIVKMIRDRWKSDNEAVKKAVDFKKEGEIPLLKDRVKTQRDTLEMVLRATLEHGHNDIIRLFGENRPMIFAIYQLLHASLKDNDYDSSFVQTTLKFLSRCSTITNDVLDATSLRKALDRLIKRGSPTAKTFAQKILDNANHKKAMASKQSAIAKPADAKAKLAPSASSAASPEKAAANRVLSTDKSSAASTVKRSTAQPSTGNTATKNASVTKKPLSSGEKAAVTKTVVSKAPTTNFFASLNVPKRTPATIAAAKQRAAAAAAAAAEAQKQKAAPAAPAFSFAQTMASLEKSKNHVEEVKKPTEKNLPPETAEQRAKRLRKEERRKLRVTFKPDAQLCEIKLFEHDPEEELGHDANMVRDVSDINSEGRMFKQHKEMMDIDDEDDEPTEKTFFDYKRPSDIDFATIEKDTSDRGFEKTGGVQKVESPEKALQDAHIANTIMVHYFTRTDIPSCPKEPFDPYSGMYQETKMGTQPPAETAYSRRAKALAPAPTPAVDINAILQGLTPLAAAPQSAPVQAPLPAQFSAPPQSQPAAMDSLAAIQNILAQFAQPNAQPQPPVQTAWQMPATQPTTHVPAQPAMPNAVDALLASLQQGPGQGTAQATAAPVVGPPVAQTAEQAAAAAQWAAMYGNPQWGQPPAAANNAAPDAAALLAMFNGSNNNAAPSYGGYGDYNQQQNGNDGYGDVGGYNARKRGPDIGEDYDQRGGKFQKNGPNRNRDWDTSDNKPRFVVQCKFYNEGKCRKGDACTFRHDDPPNTGA